MRTFFTVLFILSLTSNLLAQESSYPNIKFSATAQSWIRYTELNPGSKVYDQEKSEVFDISLRRLRLSAGGMITPKAHIYVALGENNINYLTNKKISLNILDVVGTYQFNEAFHIGAGKTAWTGLSRYSAPSSSNNMGMDLPLFALPTLNLSDDFFRKLSVFAKGDVGKVNYRMVLTKPFAIESRGITPGIDSSSGFAAGVNTLQSSGYVKYQFLDRESNSLPFHRGTYYGKKRIVTIGFGYQYQPDLMWSLGTNGDTLTHAMNLKAIDLFVDLPFYSSALTAYLGFFDYDFGPNYIRNIGMNNPSTGKKANEYFNGSGNSFPTIGTGQILYGEVGWLFNDLIFPEKFGNLQWYATGQLSYYEALADPVTNLGSGINYVNPTERVKITLGAQFWPVFQGEDVIEFEELKHAFILKTQFKF